MAHVVGNLKSLAASERHALERLAAKRVASGEIAPLELSRKIARLCADIALQLGLLVGRDGTIEYVIVGTKDRIYLPDLGRFRLDPGRLRRLRLIVFSPPGGWTFLSQRVDSPSLPRDSQRARGRKQPERATREIPRIPNDLITDLEKLRLDALLFLGVEADGAPGPFSLAYLVPDGGSLRPGVGIFGGDDLHEIQGDFELFLADSESILQKARPKVYETGRDKAILVGASTGTAKAAEASMLELQELARTAGIEVLDTIIQRRRSLDPKRSSAKGRSKSSCFIVSI